MTLESSPYKIWCLTTHCNSYSYIIIQLIVVSTSVLEEGLVQTFPLKFMHLTAMCALKSDCFNRIFNVNSNIINNYSGCL